MRAWAAGSGGSDSSDSVTGGDSFLAGKLLEDQNPV